MNATDASRRKAVFLDKDGTLIPDIPYNVDPARITIADSAIEGLQLLKASHFLLVVVSNQSGVARGYFEEAALNAVWQKTSEILRPHGVTIDGFYYCPHHPGGSVERYAVRCACRKPLPGLLLKAAEELSIDLQRSWMIGDALTDVEAGARAGCKAVFINSGRETKPPRNEYQTPAFTAKDLQQAAVFIRDTVAKSATDKS